MRIQVEIPEGHGRGLRDPSAGVVQRLQQQPVPGATPTGLIGRIQQGLHLRARKRVYGLARAAFDGHRQHLAYRGQILHGDVSGEVHERPDRGQPEIAGGDAVVPLLLQVIQKSEYG